MRRFVFVLILALAACGLLWRFTGLHHRLDMATLIAFAEALPGHSWTPWAMIGLYVAGGLAFFAHAILLWTTVLLFDPWHALLYAELGTIASALAVYALGRVVRPDVVRWLAGSYLEEVSQALGERGRRTLILLHWFPVCPFSVLNFLSGATHIAFFDFVIGTVVGCTPGVILLSFFGHQIRQLLHHRRWLEIIPILGALTVLFIFNRWVRTRIERKRKSRPPLEMDGRDFYRKEAD